MDEISHLTENVSLDTDFRSTCISFCERSVENSS